MTNTIFPRAPYELGWHNASPEGVNEFQKKLKLEIDPQVWQDAYKAGQEARRTLAKRASEDFK